MLHLYDTLTGRKRPFTTLKTGEVSMYVCGVTLYDDIHIGHLKSIIAFEVMRNYFESQALRVKLVRNITDVDDKIINKAKMQNIDPLYLVNTYIKSFHDLLNTMKIRAPDIEPRVTSFLPHIDTYVQELIDTGAAYEAEDGIYFDTQKNPINVYPLSKKVAKDLLNETRLADEHYHKRHQADFALWKKDEDYGYLSNVFKRAKGRPGWHIECSVMHHYTLGKQFDIHGGGRDLIFPHHENEISQSMAHNQINPATFWVHNGMMTKNGQKLSKSLGNSIYVKDLLKEYLPEALKLFLSKSHYAASQEYEVEELKDAHYKIVAFYETISNLTGQQEYHPLWSDFISALEDDFNTPQAIALLNKQLKLLNETKNPILAKEVLKMLQMLAVLPQEASLESLKVDWQNKQHVPDHIQMLFEQRQEAKRQKNYQLSDNLRKEILNLGWEVRDSKTQSHLIKV